MLTNFAKPLRKNKQLFLFTPNAFLTNITVFLRKH
jgi:hypothetical protein